MLGCVSVNGAVSTDATAIGGGLRLELVEGRETTKDIGGHVMLKDVGAGSITVARALRTTLFTSLEMLKDWRVSMSDTVGKGL